MFKIFLLAIGVFIFSTSSSCQVIKDSVVIKNSDNNPTTETDSRIFEKVESEATFPGGVTAWIQYLQENLNADVPVKKKAPVGTYMVIVKFIVGKNGKIRNIIAETNYGHGMEKEVVRIIKKGPDWLPAMQNGRAVNAYRRQPVTFIVSEE